MPLDEGVNVRHARVANLDRVPVEDGVQLGAFGKMNANNPTIQWTETSLKIALRETFCKKLKSGPPLCVNSSECRALFRVDNLPLHTWTTWYNNEDAYTSQTFVRIRGSPPILSLFGFSEMSDNWRPPLKRYFLE